jgi:small subunit ribosomal protein S16
MAVHIRLARAGAKKRPFYRLVVTDHRSPRGGRFLENIGTFDPSKDPGLFQVDRARLEYWRGVGAVPSETVDRLLKANPPVDATATPAAK